MSKKKVYISGKITGLDINVARNYFDTTAEAVKCTGHEPVNPMEVVPYNPEWSWEQYMLADIQLIFGCDAILMLDNWKDSKGARCEHALAIELGLEIHYGISSLNKAA